MYFSFSNIPVGNPPFFWHIPHLLTQLSLFRGRLGIERLRGDVNNILSTLLQLRPPQEFFDFRRVSKPANFGEAQGRISYNLGYYSANYVAIVAILSVYALVTNFLLMFVILLVAGGVFGISRLGGNDLVLPFGRFNSSQLYTGLMIVAIPLTFLASPISTMMWLIGSSMVTVGSHATLMEKPIETVFEEEVWREKDEEKDERSEVDWTEEMTEMRCIRLHWAGLNESSGVIL